MKKIDLNYFLKLSLVYFLEICSKLNGLKDTATILVIKVESWQRDGDVHHFGVLPALGGHHRVQVKLKVSYHYYGPSLLDSLHSLTLSLIKDYN